MLHARSLSKSKMLLFLYFALLRGAHVLVAAFAGPDSERALRAFPLTKVVLQNLTPICPLRNKTAAALPVLLEAVKARLVPRIRSVAPQSKLRIRANWGVTAPARLGIVRTANFSLNKLHENRPCKMNALISKGTFGNKDFEKENHHFWVSYDDNI